MEMAVRPVRCCRYTNGGLFREEHEVVSADRLMVWIDVSPAAKSNFQKGLYNEIEH
jgi:hypothetical protein